MPPASTSSARLVQPCCTDTAKSGIPLPRSWLSLTLCWSPGSFALTVRAKFPAVLGAVADSVSGDRPGKAVIPAPGGSGSCLAVPTVDQNSKQEPRGKRDPNRLIGMLSNDLVRRLGTRAGSILQLLAIGSGAVQGALSRLRASRAFSPTSPAVALIKSSASRATVFKSFTHLSVCNSAFILWSFRLLGDLGQQAHRQ